MKLAIPFLLLSVGLFGFSLNPSQTAPKREVDFDREVMPIISTRCYKCHGPDAATAAAGLRLDSFEIATKVGAIVPHDPVKSLIMQRITEKDPANRMPPPDSGVKPLTEEQIETLREWIKQGAVYNKHWSYIPPKLAPIPKVSDPTWCKNLIDKFVLAKLDESKLTPEPEADRDTLALRAAQTLTGLPPSQADLETYRNDKQPGAYERFVDKLLNEPEYGEHEARYWLDAVRYGDTHGLQLDNERGIYPYRDWVVRAYNEDLPFSKFVEWQLAGDLFPNPTTEQMIATGYVRMNLSSNEGGAIAEEFLARNTFDRVDTTSTVFMGMTVQCARCHDHKYDPIKQKDYYGLYAFFNSTQEYALDGNIALPPPVVRAADPEEVAKLTELSNKLEVLRASTETSTALNWFDKNHVAAPVTRDWEISPVYTAASFDDEFNRADPPEPGQTVAVAWKPYAFELGKAYPGIVGKDASAIYLRGKVSMPAARTFTFGVSSDDAVKVWLNGKLIHANKINRGVDDAVDQVKGDFKAGDNDLLIKIVNGAGPDGVRLNLTNAADNRINAALAQVKKSPQNVVAQKELRAVYLEFGPDTPEAKGYRNLIKEQSEVESAIPMTLVAKEMSKPRPTFILKRGLYDQPGDPVTRHVPPAFGTMPPNAPKNRLGFAKWLTAPENPLLARVYVNRIWQQHFGNGLVKTADDFGSQGEWPVNQPLLDYLAVSFQKNKWSVKQLNRLIVTSATFRQSSKITKAKLAADPENRLVSRGPRFRLDAEVIRDKALYSGGLLLEKLGGKGFKPYQPDNIWESASDPASNTHIYVKDTTSDVYRRSVYLYWKRTAPPPAMVNLDAPLRDTCIVKRSTTNTPLQALTLQNEPAFLEASRTMAQRILQIKGSDDNRIQAAFAIAMARDAKPSEITIIKGMLTKFRARYTTDPAAAKKLIAVGGSPAAMNIPPAEQATWMLVSSTLMNTDEFLTQH